jgi:hypothetical protein
MIRKFSLAVALLLAAQGLPNPGHAHDEGHGPKLTDAGRQGGVVSPVVLASDARLGARAALVYKAELVRSDDGTVRVYLYDAAMKPLDASRFGPAAEALIQFKKGRKWESTKLELKLEDGAFVGTAAKPRAKPYNIDIHLSEGGRKLLSAFDNLD